ncbi:hypothetical protein ACKI1I_15020 [Streptomyces turgidiscabies]|uniref:Uncharacterized protein n=1 Tax=Streptomyces turgidiscabies (strain Car8) TaxID=698760 RepID=L7EUX4_STRT8|nr:MULTISPECIES: hypothetical protein [Streptomyces]ELP63208.1 hypothetical protein STRTUCAR8_06350 [Streptomyces turgidiscabies Car8]MDX3493191.1 hypothetical protein [Streptomyces turgidiscabies]GAQ70488.1 hypothetical protein T45_02223 [Streptomyces turgidiscabies]
MGAGLVLLVIPLFLYLVLVILLCVKVGVRVSRKMGWLFAVALVFGPVALLTVGGLYDAGVL